MWQCAPEPASSGASFGRNDASRPAFLATPTIASRVRSRLSAAYTIIQGILLALAAPLHMLLLVYPNGCMRVSSH